MMGPAVAATRPGAARALSLEWPASASAGGRAANDANSVSHVRLAPLSFRGGAGSRRNAQTPALIFTRQGNGTRNLWMATPNFSNPRETSDNKSAASGFDWTVRGMAWSARPLTQLQAPFWIDEAWPLDDGKTLLCVTNALPSVSEAASPLVAGAKSQIARLDASTGRLEALTNSASLSHSPSLSPDGTRFAFVSDRSGFDAVYVMPVGGGSAQIAATWARRPCWLDNQTLLFQNARGERAGLFRVALPRSRDDQRDDEARPLPRMLLANAVEAAVSPDGQTVCAVVETPSEAQRGARPGSSAMPASRLVMMASDGSGARTLSETAGARRPGFAPDGSAVLFDAPQSGQIQNAGQSTLGAQSARLLWSLPLLRVAPIAVLQRVRPVAAIGTLGSAGSLEVLGTAFSSESGPLRVRLEIGIGEAPDQWTTLATRSTPVQSGRLAVWQPPAARGEWLLRLTVVDAAGDSVQSTLPVVLPLSTGREAFLLPPDFGDPNVDNLPNRSAPPDNALGGPLAPNPVGPPSPTVNPQTEPPIRAPQSSRPPSRVLTPALAPVPTPTPRPSATVARPTPARSATPSSGRNTVSAQANTANTTPARRNQGGTSGGGTVPFLPLPALPPAPAPRATPAMPEGFPAAGVRTQPTPLPTPRRPATVSRPAAATPTPRPTPLPILRAPEAGAAEPSPPPLPIFPSANASRSNRSGSNTRNANLPQAAQSTLGRRDSVDSTTPDAAPNGNKSGDAAQLRVIGAPVSMTAGERATVSIAMRNLGTTSWASAGDRPVRAFVRWIDERSGYRRRWSYQWLRASVAPGAASTLSFTFTAPPSAGRYKLSFALVRLTQDGPSIAPPATDREAQRRWPGEFGTVSFNVSVRGNASGNADER